MSLRPEHSLVRTRISDTFFCMPMSAVIYARSSSDCPLSCTLLSGWTATGTGLASIVWISGTLLGIGGAAALLLPKRDWASSCKYLLSVSCS